MQSDISEKMKLAMSGSHMVKIVFDPEYRDIISQFLDLVEKSFVEVSEDDSSVLQDIVDSPCSCTHHLLLVSLGDNLDELWFVENIGPAIENIEVA